MISSHTHIALSTSNLFVGYAGNNSIVQDVNIKLEIGELVGLVGINGSGKSTLLRTLAGLQHALSGKIEISNKQLENYTVRQLSKELSVVLTGQSISKNLTAIELVALGRHPYTNLFGQLSQEDKDAIIESMTVTDIMDISEKPCYALSDGQLQRVLIARALAQDTKLILLDEPLTHLDLHHKAALLKLLAKIAEEQQKTILFSTHDIEHAIPMCDTMIVLQNKQASISSPQKLIQTGVFDTLFPDTNVRFDRDLGRFFVEN